MPNPEQTLPVQNPDVVKNGNFIRQKTLLQGYVPFSAATLWRLIRAGKFPRPVKVTNQITAWRTSEINEWSKNPVAYVAEDGATS